jgi:hypothetical protein
MRTIQINIPDNVEMSGYDFSMMVAAMVGLSKRAFIELPGKYGVSLYSSSISDLHSDIANA